jgi:hypothetical protein
MWLFLKFEARVRTLSNHQFFTSFVESDRRSIAGVNPQECNAFFGFMRGLPE